MTGGRFLILLIVSAAGLLGLALAVTTGNGVGAGTAKPGTLGADLVLLQGAQALADTFAPSSRGELATLLLGLLAGWTLRWFYCLPWGNVPRAIADWLLGWRTSAAMVGLAVGCTVILLFY